MKINSKTMIKKAYFFTISIFLLMQAFESCTTYNFNDRDCYDIKSIDSTLFSKYLFITIANSSKSKRYLISNKDTSQSFSENKYEILKLNNKYCFELYSIDTSIKTSLYGKISQNNPDIYLDDKLIWSNGKIVCKTYICPDIKDKYIIRK